MLHPIYRKHCAVPSAAEVSEALSGAGGAGQGQKCWGADQGARTAEGWIRDIGHPVAAEQSALCSHRSSAMQASQSHRHHVPSATRKGGLCLLKQDAGTCFQTRWFKTNVALQGSS